MKMASHQAGFVCVVMLIGSTTLFISPPALSCQVYPSEYAYHNDSVNRVERSSANCRRYQSGLQQNNDSYNYIHCDSTQIRLTDSELGSEQYISSDYYVWSTRANRRQLLFIFPTRVKLATITLHYYSDSVRGLPSLRFYAVPDDFDVWDAPIAMYSSVEVAAAPPDRETAGRRNVSISNFNFTSSKVLMTKSSSYYQFALSEMEFFTCNETVETTLMITVPIQKTTQRSREEKSTTTAIKKNTTNSNSVVLNIMTGTASPSATATKEEIDLVASASGKKENDSSKSVREAIAWTLVAISTVLFVGLLTINIIMLWVYKKRQAKDNRIESPKYEMEGNPCYEVSNMKRTTERAEVQEVHLYERVDQNKTK